MRRDVQRAESPGTEIRGMHSMVSGGRDAELFDDVVESVVGDAQVARRIDSSDREVVEESYFDLGAIYRYLFARRWVCSEFECTYGD